MEKSTNRLPKIGITQGDANGVGLELVLRIFETEWLFNYCIPVLYGSPKSFAFLKKQLGLQNPVYQLVRTANDARPGKFNLVNCNDAAIELKLGKASEDSAKEAFLCLEKAVEEANLNMLDAIVTAPLDKSTVAAHHSNFTGHTGYIAAKMSIDEYAMVLMNEDIKIALVTEHVSVAQIAQNISTDKVYSKIKLLHRTLQNDFLITKPRIAVLGLNPHAGDNGLIGEEEKNIIHPAIQKAFEENILVYGTYSADSFFGAGQHNQFDAVLAMYHDQGLIPFKTFAFYDGVNYTAGLPVPRTSPDHGTAYNLAGKGEAETLSMQNAIFSAIQIVRNRKQLDLDNENPLPYTELKREKFRMDF